VFFHVILFLNERAYSAFGVCVPFSKALVLLELRFAAVFFPEALVEAVFFAPDFEAEEDFAAVFLVPAFFEEAAFFPSSFRDASSACPFGSPEAVFFL
jgi:hypothetical protein